MSAAMTELFRNHEARLLRLFQKKTGDFQESRDLLQDLYESALRNLDSFSLVEDQAAWLFRAAHNRIIDWYRGKSRRDSVSLDKQIDDEGSLLDLLVDDKENLEDAYFRTPHCGDRENYNDFRREFHRKMKEKWHDSDPEQGEEPEGSPE